MEIIGSADVSITRNAYNSLKANEIALEAKQDALEAAKAAMEAGEKADTALEKADGSKIYYGSVQPDNPSQGDLWFVYDENGVAVSLQLWDGTQWVDQVDLTEIGQALSDAEAAQVAAQDAASKASKAQSDAEDALRNASVAQLNSESALDGAAEAISNVNTLTGEVTTVKTNVAGIQADVYDSNGASRITQLSDSINLKVSVDDVVNQINVSKESILINGNRIQITGDTYIENGTIKTATIADAAITNAKIGSLDAAKISTGTLSADRIAASSITAAKLNVGTLSAISANLGTITAGTLNGININLGTYNSSTSHYPLELKSDGSLYGSKITLVSDSDSLTFGKAPQVNISDGGWEGTGRISREFDNYDGTYTTAYYDTVTSIREGQFRVTAKNKSNSTSSVAGFDNFSQRSLYICERGFTANMGVFTGVATTSATRFIDFWPGENGADNTSASQRGMRIFSGAGMSIEGGTSSTSFDVVAGGVMSITSAKQLGLSSNATMSFNYYGSSFSSSFYLSQDSTGPRIYSPEIYERTYSSGATVLITTSGTLGRLSSATKYKIQIEPQREEKYERLLDLVPKTWFDKKAVEMTASIKTRIEEGEDVDLEKEDPGEIRRIPGLIAEDVAAVGLEDYVVYGDLNDKGEREVEGIMYERLWTLLIPLVKSQRDRIEALETAVTALKQA